MSIHRWVSKQMWYIHTMEYYSAMKTNKLLMHTTTWMHMTIIMLSKSIQIKECIKYDSMYMKLECKMICIDIKQISGCLGIRVDGGKDYKEAGGKFWG